MSSRVKFYLLTLFVWLALFLILFVIFIQVERQKTASTELLQRSILQEAVSHLENIIDTRKWNASHGAVYIKQHDGIQPNPYLLNNTLKTDTNETLIKVNPAWMTRQISEIANQDNSYYYKITSLKPINSNNKADSFETEALEFFEKNPDEKYYYNLPEDGNSSQKFNFMGSLKVNEECMSCHAYQGYAIGDIRGGIRVSIPTKIYNESLVEIKESSLIDKYRAIIFALVVGMILSVYIRTSFKHDLVMKNLNDGLEQKVQERTRELNEINDTLEERVASEVEKNRLHHEAMLTQSRYVAMGEMIGMLAHQWRQPISIINMQANNLLVEIELGVEETQEIKKELEGITLETQKLSEIISSFSDLFEKNSVKESLKVESVLENALSVLNANFEAYNIVVKKEYSSSTKISIVSQELFQVFWNILKNANDILIEREVKNPLISITLIESEDEIITTISDNAGGVDDNNYDAIFEPYYSTNSNLNGKGLGLYISKNIMEKELRGAISVQNSRYGADFIVRIPKGES
jgi:C4-dicarboxylate-specific signal transduction histidine kinase